MSAYATIDDLRSQLGAGQAITPEYRAKQLHELPKAETVDRNKFILDHCKGKRVLEFGASGPLHDAITEAATYCHGVDRQDNALAAGRGGYLPHGSVEGFDLDDVGHEYVPGLGQVFDVIVCGEVLEHLSNPGWFLTRLKRQFAGVPVIITVPNAYAEGSRKWLAQGIENVNKDHVAFYSPKTLSVLLVRAGFTVGGLFYYNGTGPTAEGLVVVTE